MIRTFARVGSRGALAICLVFTAISAVEADSISGNGIPNIFYDPATGQLAVTTDGADMSTVLVEGPTATSIDRWLDGTMQDGAGWAQAYINNREQWVIWAAFVPGGTGAEFVPQGTYQIATYDTNSVSIADFGSVELATQNPLDTLLTTVDLVSSVFVAGDFDASGLVEQGDLDLVLLNWGASTPPVPGDWVNDLPDESIDQNELDRLLLGWGTGGGAIALATVVPEPVSSGLWMAAMSLAAMGLRRREKKGQKA